MSVVSLRLPNSLHETVKSLAKDDGVSINHYLTLAISERVAVQKYDRKLREYARGVTKEEAMNALDSVADVPADHHDKL